jgi:hypothetical protein
MGVRPVMTCVSIGGNRGFIGFTILVGSVRRVAQLCVGIAVGVSPVGVVSHDEVAALPFAPR